MYVRAQHIRDVFNEGTKNTGPEPFVKVEIGSVDNLETFLNKAMKEKKISSYSYDNTKDDTLTDILINFVPWIVLILFWVWFMRRMSGGPAGGSGVFSVGKSKARMYERATL